MDDGARIGAEGAESATGGRLHDDRFHPRSGARLRRLGHLAQELHHQLGGAGEGALSAHAGGEALELLADGLAVGRKLAGEVGRLDEDDVEDEHDDRHRRKHGQPDRQAAPEAHAFEPRGDRREREAQEQRQRQRNQDLLAEHEQRRERQRDQQGGQRPEQGQAVTEQAVGQKLHGQAAGPAAAACARSIWAEICSVSLLKSIGFG